MKKLALFLMCIFSLVLLSSCTDSSMKGISENDTINIGSYKVYNVDKTKIKRPGGQGGN